MTTHQIEVDDETWEKYKKTVPRDVKLQEPIEEFIKKRVEIHENQGNTPSGETQFTIGDNNED